MMTPEQIQFLATKSCNIVVNSNDFTIEELKLFDIILAKNVYSESNFALTFNNENCHIVDSSSELNNIIKETALKTDIKIVEGNTICNECFDPYMTDENFKSFMDRVPKDFNALSGEMEAFALCYIAKYLNKKATCLMTVVDSRFIDAVATTEQREKGLNNMIQLALDSSLEC